MKRNTSIQAYQTIKENGLLSWRRMEVYECLYHHGPMTGKQLTISLNTNQSNSGAYATRLSELRDRGVVQELGTTKCEYTGYEVILWDVTSNLPTDFKKPPSEKEELREENASLKSVILGLRSDLRAMTDNYETAKRAIESMNKSGQGMLKL